MKQPIRAYQLTNNSFFFVLLRFTFIMLTKYFQLDPNAGKDFMGYIVAANPFAQMLFSPLVGWWSNKLGSIRLPVLVSLALFTVASAMYSSLELFSSHRKYWMFGTRFLVGVSSGMFLIF